MSGDLDLEQRYRRVLRLLPGYYRDKWEQDMVAAFLDSWMTGDPDEDSVTMEYDRPGRQEIASVAGLAARLYLGGAATPRRYFAWGQAVRLAVLAVVLVHATQGLALLTLLTWRRHLAGWFPALPASLAGPVPGGAWPMVMNAVDCVWIVIFVALVLGHHRMARVVAALAIAVDLVFLLQAQFAGLLLRPLGTWSSWFLLDFALVLAMAAFHRDAPPAARRPWLLALPGYYLLVPVPVLVLQATGNQAWLPDSAGLGCLVVSLACLAHAPRALSRPRQAAGSGTWSLALTLLAAVAGAWRIVSLGSYLHDPHLIKVGLAELLILLAAVAMVIPDAARAQTAAPAPPPHPHPDEQTTAYPEEDPGHAVPAPAAPGACPGQRAGRGPHAHGCQLQPPDSARAGRAAATSSAVTDRPAGHARPEPHASRRVPGRFHQALRAGPRSRVLPPAQRAGDDHLRGGLPGPHSQAGEPPGRAPQRVRTPHRPARRRAGGADRGQLAGL